MQGTIKRVSAMLLALLMAISFMPAIGAQEAHADEEGITVYMTVSNKGVIAKTNDGDAMAWKEVNVKDIDSNGEYTFHEALIAAHEQYNSADGYAASDTGWVEKLWGNSDAGVYSFIKNDAPTDVVTDTTVTGGDYLEASVNQDGTMYSDWMTFFDRKETTVMPGEEFTLNLKGLGAMTTNEPIALKGAKIGIVENGTFSPIDDIVTDEDGDATISLDRPGRYVISAEGGNVDNPLDLEPTYGLMASGRDKDGKTIYGRMDWDTYDTFIAYTENDYGAGPYPLDEINWIDMLEFDADEFSDGYLLYSGVVTNCPLIAPACIVNVAAEPVEASISISDKGTLASDDEGDAMASRYLYVSDENADGIVSFEEALLEAHRTYCVDGENGFEAGYPFGPGYYAVTKVWGVSTSNISFRINGETFGSSVDATPIQDTDKLYVSINKDNENYADVYTEFDSTGIDAFRTEKFTLNLVAYPDPFMVTLQSDYPEGIQLGIWKNGKFEPIEGAVTDENGQAEISFDETGDYLVTAQGTLKGEVVIDWTTEETAIVDCPIMAPYCMVSVYANPDDVEAAEPVIEAIDNLPDPDKLTLADKAKVDAVRAQYNALTDPQKECVYNEPDLKLAEATVAKLDAEDKLAKAEAAKKAAEEAAAKSNEDKAKAEADAAKAKEDAAKAQADLAKANSDLKAAKKEAAAAKKKNAKAANVITVNTAKVTNKAIAKAIKKAGGNKKYVKTIILGKKVKKIAKKAFAKYKKAKMLVLQTKKLKKKAVKASLKGSKINKVRVEVGKDKTNKKCLKKYKKIFTKKNCGKKVSIK